AEQFFLPETFKLAAPLSPHTAAERENVEIELEDFVLPPVPYGRHLIVEGAGGLMVPLNQKHTMLDLICHLELPALVVARSSLGTINHTVLTTQALVQRGVKVLGVVMNGDRNDDNRRAIEHFSGVPVVAQIERLTELARETLESIFQREFGSMT